MTDLYDVEQALREIAQYRRRNDTAAAAQVGISDQVATNMTRHYPTGLEDAGTALVIAAASLGVLVREGLSAAVVVNILGLTGQRMVLDSRAAEPVPSEPAPAGERSR